MVLFVFLERFPFINNVTLKMECCIDGHNHPHGQSWQISKNGSGEQTGLLYWGISYDQFSWYYCQAYSAQHVSSDSCHVQKLWCLHVATISKWAVKSYCNENHWQSPKFSSLPWLGLTVMWEGKQMCTFYHLQHGNIPCWHIQGIICILSHQIIYKKNKKKASSN